MSHYQIRIHGIFESAHYLYNYHGEGQNEALHGHTFETEVFIESETIKNGISVDFLDVRKHFDILMKEMDHTCLNTIFPFTEENPTAENIARYVVSRIESHLEKDAVIREVRVWEGPLNYASFFP